MHAPALERLIADEFPLDDSLVYLNHAAVSPWPRRTARALNAFAAENLSRGAADYPRWLQTEQRLRERLATLINAAGAEDIALLKNTSEALSTVAYGIDWNSGDNIVSFRQEFPSNRIVWDSLARFGVELRLAETSGSDPEQQLFDQCDDATRLISVSSVQYADGLRMDLERIGRFCRRRNILFCIDAIQSLGALDFDVQRYHADFVMADGHKWMLAPEGLALFYTRPEVRAGLDLNQYGWHMLDDPADFDAQAWRPASSGRRFECGSPNMLGIHALDASLSLIQEIGIEQIEQRLTANTGYLMELLDDAALNIEIQTDTRPSRRSGILNFRPVVGHATEALYQALMKRGVICACRGGGIRFSPHFYLSKQKLQRAVAILTEILSH